MDPMEVDEHCQDPLPPGDGRKTELVKTWNQDFENRGKWKPLTPVVSSSEVCPSNADVDGRNQGQNLNIEDQNVANSNKGIEGNNSNSSSGRCSDSSGGETTTTFRMPHQQKSAKAEPPSRKSQISSGSSSSDDEFNDGYDDQLLGDEEDRTKLALMTEREREQEIFLRSERREELKIRFEIQQKLKHSKKQMKQDQAMAQSHHGMKGDAAVSEAKQRSHDRKKIMEGKIDPKSQAMDELRAQREERKIRAAEKDKIRLQREEGRKLDAKESALTSQAPSTSSHSQRSAVSHHSEQRKQKLRVTDVYGDSDSDSDSSDDSELMSVSVVGLDHHHRRRDHRKNTRVSVKQEGCEGVAQLNRSRAKDSDSSEDSRSRSKSSSPDRPRSPAVKYVRNVQDLNRARVSRHKCEELVHHPGFNNMIVGCFVRVGIGKSGDKCLYRVTEVMAVEEGSQVYALGPTRTNKQIRVRFGMDERSFRLEFLSNSEFSTEEFERWKTVCDSKEVARPTLDHIRKKAKDLKDILTYQIQDADITKMVQSKRKFELVPENIAKEKAVLLSKKECALREGDINSVNDIEMEIRKLDEMSTSMNETRTSNMRNVTLINVRNRKRNMEMMELALQQERKDGGNVHKPDDDPFTRRTTKPTRPAVRQKELAIPETPEANNNGTMGFPPLTIDLSGAVPNGPAAQAQLPSNSDHSESQSQIFSSVSQCDSSIGGSAGQGQSQGHSQDIDPMMMVTVATEATKSARDPKRYHYQNQNLREDGGICDGIGGAQSRSEQLAQNLKKKTHYGSQKRPPRMVIDKEGLRQEMEEADYGLRGMTLFVQNHFEDLTALHDFHLDLDAAEVQPPPGVNFTLKSKINSQQFNSQQSVESSSQDMHAFDMMRSSSSEFTSADVASVVLTAVSRFPTSQYPNRKRITLEEYKKRHNM